MRTLFTIICLLFALVQGKAQNTFDTIVKNDKTEIKAKIEEVTETTIKYKKFEMLDGPTYNINLSDVFMVIYKNGTKEYIKAKEAPQPVVQNTTSTAPLATQATAPTTSSQAINTAGGHPQLALVKRAFEFEGRRLTTHSDLIAIFEKYGYHDLTAKYKESRTTGYIVGGVGLICVVVGIATGTFIYLFPAGLAVSVIGGKIRTGVYKDILRQFNEWATKKTAFNSTSQLSPTSYAGAALGN